MAKETPYFSHDYYSRSGEEIQVLITDHGPGIYGIFWAIIEILHEEESHTKELTDVFYKALGKQMSTPVEQIITYVRDLVQIDLLKFDTTGNFIYSDRVDRNIKIRNSISEKRSKAGKESASKRALLKESSTSVQQVLTVVQQNSTKERKGKEIKGKEINILFDVFWDLYENKVGDKEKCRLKWEKLSDKDRQKIIDTLPIFKSNIKDKQFQPHPQTYLNGKRWNDEIKTTVKTKNPWDHV